MQLNDYLTAEKIKPAEFARRIGRSRATVHNILHRERMPAARLVPQIQVATAGQVGFADFFGPADGCDKVDPEVNDGLDRLPAG